MNTNSTNGPGSLPILDGEPVSTPWYDLGRSQATTAVLLRGIATFSGKSGTGKTTTAVSQAQAAPMRFVYMQLRHRAGTRDVAQSLYESLHPQDDEGMTRTREREFIRGCTDTLLAGNIGVVADEVHYIGVPGMILLAQIWESVRMATGKGFPLFLVGSKVNAAIASAPELDTRVAARANFYPLRSPDLLKAVKAMDARCQATPDDRLLQVDRLWGRGRLRYWRTFMATVNLDPAKAGREITVTEIKGFLVNQGRTLKEPAA